MYKEAKDKIDVEIEILNSMNEEDAKRIGRRNRVKQRLQTAVLEARDQLAEAESLLKKFMDRTDYRQNRYKNTPAEKLTEERFKELMTLAIKASLEDPENNYYGLFIDVRGHKNFEDYTRTEFLSFGTDEVDQMWEAIKDADGAELECYWNDPGINNAEGDGHGIQIAEGLIWAYGIPNY